MTESLDKKGNRQHGRYYHVSLTALLFGILLIHPLFAGSGVAELVLSSLFTLMALSVGVSIWTQRKLRVVLAVMTIPWLGLTWLDDFVALGPVWEISRHCLLTMFMLFVVVILMTNIMKVQVATKDTMAQAASAYLMLGMAWTGLYSMVMRVDPTAFNVPAELAGQWHWMIYFSFTTLTTLGYGDITPLSPLARSLVLVEAVIGPLYLAILVARLVALYQRKN